MSKPIRVFWSELSNRFYATASYKDMGNGVFVCTGKKYDVTNDIAAVVLKHDLEFTPRQDTSE